MEYSGWHLSVWAVCVLLWGHQKHQESSWVERWIDMWSSCWCTQAWWCLELVPLTVSTSSLLIQHCKNEDVPPKGMPSNKANSFLSWSNIRCSCSCIYSLIWSHVGLLELYTERKTIVEFFFIIIVTYLRCITPILYISGDSQPAECSWSVFTGGWFSDHPRRARNSVPQHGSVSPPADWAEGQRQRGTSTLTAETRNDRGSFLPL